MSTPANVPTPPESHLRIAGIDPGAKTGVVILELPNRVRDLDRAHWLGSFSLSGSAQSGTRTKAEAAAVLFTEVLDVLSQHNVEEIAIECPIDALPSWGRNTRMKGAPQLNRATLFGSGAHYGLVLGACRACPTVRKITSYHVTTTTKHEGWMPMVTNGRLKHAQKRDVTMQQLRDELLRLFGGQGSRSADDVPLSEDELMAFGVLRYHVAKTPSPPAPRYDEKSTGVNVERHIRKSTAKAT